MPGLLGPYPLYKEKLGYVYLFEKLFLVTKSNMWSFDAKKFPTLRLLKKFFSEVDHYKDFFILFLIGITFIKYRIKCLFKRYDEVSDVIPPSSAESEQSAAFLKTG